MWRPGDTQKFLGSHIWAGQKRGILRTSSVSQRLFTGTYTAIVTPFEGGKLERTVLIRKRLDASVKLPDFATS